MSTDLKPKLVAKAELPDILNVVARSPRRSGDLNTLPSRSNYKYHFHQIVWQLRALSRHSADCAPLSRSLIDSRSPNVIGMRSD